MELMDIRIRNMSLQHLRMIVFMHYRDCWEIWLLVVHDLIGLQEVWVEHE